MAAVYGLVATRDLEEIRYIGQTKKDPNLRLRCHIRSAVVVQESRHVYAWIRKELRDGFAIQIVVLKNSLSVDQAKELEIEIIARYRAAGARLTNITAGGDGTRERPIPEDQRAKISKALRGRKLSQETRAKMSEVAKVRTYSSETRAKMSESASKKRLSPEHREKISKGLMGRKLSSESVERGAAARRGVKRTPEQRARMSAAQSERQRRARERID